jgi:phage baseplate assembly protein W
MAYDVKMFALCDHYVEETQYNGSKCIRCYGKGYYLDVFFDKKNEYTVSLASGVDKLKQEILKIMLEEKGSNVFHPNWGNEIRERVVGKKNISSSAIRLEVLVRDAIQYLQSVKDLNNVRYQNALPDEMIDYVDSVKVVQTSQNGYDIYIVVVNKDGKFISLGLDLNG